MQKNYFHYNKSKTENKNKNNFIQTTKIKKERIVDINILLNRVKIEEKNEIKRKIIFFSLISLSVILFGTFISIIK